MKRTTILLPDDLAYLLDRERRRRGVSTAAIVREALAAYFNVSEQPRRLRFIALGDSGLPDLGQNDEKYLAEAWGSPEFYEEVMGHPPPEASGHVDAIPADHATANLGSLTAGAAPKVNAAGTDESGQSV